MIEFHNVYLSFGQKTIFSNFNLKIKKGEKIVFIGKSGCGKSSLFELLLGFKKPEKGNIIFKDKKLDASYIWQVRRQIAYVDQDVSFPNQKVFDFLNFIFSFKANKHLEFEQNRLISVLEKFELDYNIINKDIGELSGGEKQRLGLVIAILLQREIFLLDEVTSSLDKKLKQKVVDYFMSSHNFTVLSISHDPEWLEHPKAQIYNLELKKWVV
ncbi:MAG: ABC transporter ATP-binding protein [Desulfonauticus sp.]|nr:ABC transporter ATP-binding protein [Desulfonauticus sp.]